MKTITFIPVNPMWANRIAPPKPASQFLPDWYKQQKALSAEKMIVGSNGVPNSTIKKCMPVFDEMTAGYIISLASDLLFTLNEDENGERYHHVDWSIADCSNFISTHSPVQVSKVPIPSGFARCPFKFKNFYRIQTPAGYSCLFKHPFWLNPDAPFLSLSGIVDTDAHPIPVEFPFLVKESFEGIIEAGTPIMQVIPFKRQEWRHEVVGDNNDAGHEEFAKTTVKWTNRYKGAFRSLKSWK
jgi:hypothetical protein